MFSTSNVAPLLEEEKKPLLDNLRNVHTKVYKTYIPYFGDFYPPLSLPRP